MNEQEIRRQLHDLAERYGEADALRAEVRARLEALDRAPGITLADTEPTPDTGRRWLPAAVTVIVVGAVAVGAYALGGSGDSDRLAIDSDDSSIASSSTPIDPVSSPPPDDPEPTGGTRPSAMPVFDLPIGDRMSVEVVGESEQLVEFAIESPDLADARLAVVAPPAADVDSADTVLEWLRSSLSQAVLDEVEVESIGGVPATVVRLSSQVDMTLTGFRLGPRTFVSASGIDRSYEAYIVDRPDGGVVIVWLDSAQAEIDAVRPVAESVIGSFGWER